MRRKRSHPACYNENGAVTDTEEIDSRIIRQPKKQIILKGTGILPAPPAGKTYSGNGAAVAQYALRFVGNPYVYGGSSLTDGADCSGFVMAVYRHFGITMAHDAGVQRTYGKEVSLAAAQPGGSGMFLRTYRNLYRRRTDCTCRKRRNGNCGDRRDIYRSGHFSKTHSRIT